MNIEFEIIKDIPVQQISKFENQTIKNVATLTRDETKSKEAFPHLTGELERTESTSEPINLGDLEYGLSAGVEYAFDVWKMPPKPETDWTNDNTEAQWYETIYKKHKGTIVQTAIITALRSIK